MTTHVVHRLVGYDPLTRKMTYKEDVPDIRMSRVKAIAQVAPEDVDAVGSYRLTNEQARRIADAADLRMPSRELLFFLEPFALASAHAL